MADKIIASFTAEQTARFLSGGELGAPTFTDPEMAATYARHQAALRDALDDCIVILGKALHEDSAATEQRLYELWDGVGRRNDPNAARLLGVMLTELVKQVAL